GHPLLEAQERLPQPLDLLVGQGAALDPAHGLPLHELAQQLDHREHELGQPALDVLRVGDHPAVEAPAQPAHLAAEGAERAEGVGGRRPAADRRRRTSRATWRSASAAVLSSATRRTRDGATTSRTGRRYARRGPGTTPAYTRVA